MGTARQQLVELNGATSAQQAQSAQELEDLQRLYAEKQQALVTAQANGEGMEKAQEEAEAARQTVKEER